MSTELVTVILFGGLICLLTLGVPVVFALASISIFVAYILGGANDLFIVATTTYRQITEYSLMSIPLFLLMGNFLLHSGISDRLFKALNYWLTGVRGGLAIVSVGVCVALAMCGGFGPGILMMGLIAVPAMLKSGYDKSLALGSVMAGGVLGAIIPPSIIMIVFAFITRLSIGRLFFGGAIPGFITASLYIFYISIRCYFQPQLAPRVAEDVTWKLRMISLKEIILPAMLIFMVLGAIFFGVATPSEAAGVGASGAFLICIIYRSFTRKVLLDSCLETMKISGMALWILVAATLFGVVYTMAGAQTLVMEIVESLQVNRWFILIAMQVILLVFGAFMDDYAVITICAPIFLPIARHLGFDPIWFGVLIVIMVQVGTLTPPIGVTVFALAGMSNVPMYT
ncbi:hypothetical protein LCGC14_1947810, partial [marine sediment metagenome]